MKYIFSQPYSLAQLSKAETYALDDNLARLCRHIITAKLDMPTGEAKRSLLNGNHPELVLPYVEELHAEYKRLMSSYEEAKSSLPQGYSFTGVEMGTEGTWAKLKPEIFNEDLHKRLKRLGAYWDGKMDGNSQSWYIPLEKVHSLNKIFSNSEKATLTANKKQEKEAEQSRIRKEQAKSEELVRLTEERKKRDLQQAENKIKQAKAVNSRIKVRAEKYQIGDSLEGNNITGFGSSWTEKGDAPKEFFSVQLWEPCICGNEPVYARSGLAFMGTQQCEKCINKKYGKDISVCYAYFS